MSKLTPNERIIAEAIEVIESLDEGKKYFHLEDILRERIVARMIASNIQKDAFDREMAYYKGQLDGLLSLKTTRDQYLSLLKEERKEN